MIGDKMHLVKSTFVALVAGFFASATFAAGGGGYVEDFDFSFEGPLGHTTKPSSSAG